MKKVEKFITIEFSWNGDLGKLQTITQQNMKTLEKLCVNYVITMKEMDDAKNGVMNYFKSQIDMVNDYPYNYIYY